MTEPAKEKQKIRMQLWRAENSQRIKDYRKMWRHANAETVAEYQKAYQDKYRKQPVAQQNYWERNLKRNYGMTADDFNRLWGVQDGECAVCGVKMTPRGRNRNAASVDHNHETGEVRGLLCRACNRGIGSLKDSPEVMESAAKYLRTFGHYGTSEQN